MQYFTGKLAEDADWAAASRMQSLKADVSASPSKGDAAKRPAIALRPSAMTKPPSRLPNQRPAEKRRKCQAKRAQAKASAAEPPAEVMAERAASETNVSHLTDRLLSLSACKCRICARKTTFAWIRQQHQHQPKGTAAFTNCMLTHVDDTREEDLSKHYTINVLSALDSLALELRHELPTGCTPTMQDVPQALPGLALHWHGLDICIDVLGTIDCLLCTGKLLAWAHVHPNFGGG